MMSNLKSNKDVIVTMNKNLGRPVSDNASTIYNEPWSKRFLFGSRNEQEWSFIVPFPGPFICYTPVIQFEQFLRDANAITILLKVRV